MREVLANNALTNIPFSTTIFNKGGLLWLERGAVNAGRFTEFFRVSLIFGIDAPIAGLSTARIVVGRSPGKAICFPRRGIVFSAVEELTYSRDQSNPGIELPVNTTRPGRPGLLCISLPGDDGIREGCQEIFNREWKIGAMRLFSGVMRGNVKRLYIRDHL
jgi:hypothetical protein